MGEETPPPGGGGGRHLGAPHAVPRQRILVAGQPYWSRQLAAQIGAHAPHVDVRHVASPLALPSRSALARPDAVVFVGFRPGAGTLRGRGFDAVARLAHGVNPSARVVRYWIGTDVEHALNDARRGRLGAAFEVSKRRDDHITVAPWLVDELGTIGIRAGYVPFPIDLPTPAHPLRLPDHFRVLAYLGLRRFDFYGGPALLEVARRLPDIAFDIVGGEPPSGVDVPANVQFLGWRSDVPQLIERSTVVVRLTRHDGLSGMVREALALGRHVIWTYPMPSVHTVQFGAADEVVSILDGLVSRRDAGTLEPNVEGRRYVCEEFEPSRLVDRLIGPIGRDGSTVDP